MVILMRKIVFYHEHNDKQFLSLMQKNLSVQYAVTMTGENAIITTSSGTDLLIHESIGLQTIQSPETILVFSEHCVPAKPLHIDPSVICIASSGNTDLLKMLADTHARVITCGMSGKDTVTYSSKSDCAISISLQREILNCSGQAIEPLELVFSLQEHYRSYELLAYAAILMLLGVVCECPKVDIPIY